MFATAPGCGVEPGAGTGVVGGMPQATMGESLAAALPVGSIDVSRTAPATCLGKRPGASFYYVGPV